MRRRKAHKLFLRKTKNNFFFTVIDDKGCVKEWMSCGRAGYKGPARSTTYAIEQAGERLIEKLKKRFIFALVVILQHKFSHAIRSFLYRLKFSKIRIRAVHMLPKIGHNGLRLKKKRRV